MDKWGDLGGILSSEFRDSHLLHFEIGRCESVGGGGRCLRQAHLQDTLATMKRRGKDQAQTVAAVVVKEW